MRAINVFGTKNIDSPNMQSCLLDFFSGWEEGWRRIERGSGRHVGCTHTHTHIQKGTRQKEWTKAVSVLSEKGNDKKLFCFFCRNWDKTAFDCVYWILWRGIFLVIRRERQRLCFWKHLQSTEIFIVYRI